MENTKIEWTDHTFNPWTGCAKVSPACDHCYAETMAKRAPSTLGGWGPGAERKRTRPDNWKGPVRWNKAAEKPACERDTDGDGNCDRHPGGCPTRRPRVFCASMADWLDAEVPIEWLADLLQLIHDTPNLDWLLLTKRPENWSGRLLDVLHLERWGEGDDTTEAGHCLEEWYAGNAPPANVWFGVTVENQAMADLRIPQLLAIPARIRFLSMEPLLGPVDFGRIRIPHNMPWSALDGHGADGEHARCAQHAPGHCLGNCPHRYKPISWVIAGGESGPGARPSHPDWFRGIRDQCAAAGVPFFFKQWGAWVPGRFDEYYPEGKPLTCMKPCGEISWWAGDSDTTINYSTNYDESDQPITRESKAAAGRRLDGKEHSAFPV